MAFDLQALPLLLLELTHWLDQLLNQRLLLQV
uniref:Uncharacterized protein n=2 Tax=Picea TaxID=3328 RepID=A0A101LTU0_PICGL|nr:hypothetical protein ABT39_MTgene3552 [Picea glauca]KUM45230.1 hypothetical protein ABT39_MTgene3553 [Picea glauca]QHR89824.1 hypothetical protein Q903MT_gene3846 [Picea sitchensis]